MSQPLCFEDISPGDTWVSLARTVTEADVVNFAGITGDYDPLHVDHEFAGSTMYRRPIAHGLLGLSFMAGLSSHFPSMRNLAFTELSNWQFLQPIFIGDTLHVVTEVLETHAKGRRSGRVIWRRRLINQAGTVVQEGNLETVVASRLGSDVANKS